MTAGRFVLVTLLAALLGTAVLAPRSDRPDPEEATLLLQAASLAADRDLAYDASDIARFRSRGWAAATRVALEPDVTGRHRFARPLPFPLLAAPFEALAPGRGALVLNVLLLALGAFLAVRQLEPRLGDAAWWLVTAALFGSATFGHALAARPEALLVAATVGALALAWPRVEEFLPLADLAAPEMNPRGLGTADSDAPAAATPPAIARWLASGVLTAVVALHHPLYLLLVPAVVGGVPRRLRAAAIPAVLAGLLLILAASWLTGTLWVEFAVGPKLAIAADGVADLAARGPSPAAGLDHRPVWPPPLTDHGLHLSNLQYLAVGRHIGLVVYFLPVLLLLRLGRGAAARGRLVAVSLLVLLGLLALFPYDLGAGAGPGSRWLVPLYAALWLTPAHRPGRVAPAVFLLAGAAVMAPAWLGQPPAETGPASRLLARLPFETTQRNVPVAAEIVRRGARVRAASAAIAPGGGDGMMLRPGGRGQLVIVADRPLERIALELGAEARGEAKIAGGVIEHEVFRPDGGVTYRLRPRRARRHSTWWSDRRQYVYQVGFSLPETRVALPFGVSVE